MAALAVLEHRDRGPEQPLDRLGNPLRLRRLVGEPRDPHRGQRRLRVALRRAERRRHQPRAPPGGGRRRLLGTGIRLEQGPDRDVEDLLVGAEALEQVELEDLSAPVPHDPRQLANVPHPRAPKGVDRLPLVAHRHDVAERRPGELLDQRELDPVGVLELVHEHDVELRPGPPPGLAPQVAERAGLQVDVVQQALAALAGLVGPLDPGQAAAEELVGLDLLGERALLLTCVELLGLALQLLEQTGGDGQRLLARELVLPRPLQRPQGARELPPVGEPLDHAHRNGVVLLRLDLQRLVGQLAREEASPEAVGELGRLDLVLDPAEQVEARPQGVLAQQPEAQPVEVRHPSPLQRQGARDLARLEQSAGQPFAQLPRRLAAEGHQQDPLKRDPLDPPQPEEPLDQHVGLPGPRAGVDQHAAVNGRLDNGPLVGGEAHAPPSFPQTME